MLHASKTWSLTRPDLQRLRCNNRAIIRQICNVEPEDVATVSDQTSCWLNLRLITSINPKRKGFAGLDTLNDSVQ